MPWFDYVLLAGLGLAPSVLWLIFFEREEAAHPTPLSATVLVFVVGALATFIALLVQVALLEQYLQPAGMGQHGIVGVSLFAVVEELIKFALVLMVVRFRGLVREPLDAMVYMITAGLGFAAVENIAVLINQGTAITSALSLESAVLRTLGATLLHAVVAGVIGFHWAIGIIRQRFVAFHIIAGLVIASVLHAVFNYLIIMTGPASWALVFAAGIGFFVLVDFEELRAQEGIADV